MGQMDRIGRIDPIGQMSLMNLMGERSDDEFILFVRR
jgi:hypothetical protein